MPNSPAGAANNASSAAALEEAALEGYDKNRETANVLMRAVLLAPEMIEALAQRSASWQEVTPGMLSSTLWAFFNTQSTPTITRQDIMLAAQYVGGESEDVDALWSLVNLDGSLSISANTFVNSSYLANTMSDTLKEVQTAVDQQRWFAPPGESLFDVFNALGGAVGSEEGGGFFF